MEIKILDYKHIGTPNLLGAVDLELNNSIRFKGCGHYQRRGERGVGLPLKKIGYQWQGVAEFVNQDEEKAFRKEALKAVETYLEESNKEESETECLRPIT